MNGVGRPAALPVLLGLAALAAAATVLALGVGTSAVGFGQLAEVIRGTADAATRSIVLEVRLPHVALAALVGAALSAAGASFQAVLRNPLADPFILGVSGGAALGSVMWAVAGPGGAPALGRPAAAFAGAMGTLVLLFALARGGGRTRPVTLLLVGVVLNAFFSAVILFLLTATDAARTRDLFFLLVGTLGEPSWGELAALVGLLAVGLPALVAAGHRMNLLAFGEEAAEHLGVNAERTTWVVVGAASLVTAAAVAFSGIVGFVGLIVPHTLRLAVGPDHRLLVPTSALGGAAFLVVADACARSALATPLPVGVVTALAGGPFFLVLLHRQLRRASR